MATPGQGTRDRSGSRRNLQGDPRPAHTDYRIRKDVGRFELADSGALIGGAALLYVKLDDQELLAMLWELAPSAVGHGLVAEAGHALTHYAFRVSAATMVHAVVRIEDQRAIATLQRAGMVQLQDIRTHHGGRCSSTGSRMTTSTSVQLAGR